MFIGKEQTEYVGAWLLLISAFAFGLPHGACDFWILQKTAQNQKNSFHPLAKNFLIYLTLSIATIAIWFFFPSFALIAFLLLTSWHFGSGDAIWEKGDKKFWVLNSFGRGFIIIFAPISFHSSQSSNVLLGLTGNTGISIVELIIKISPFILSIGIIFLIIETILTKNMRTLSSQLIKWTEIILLLITFWLTSPILAVAFYLVGVHSWRHILRLEFYASGENEPRETTVRQSIVNFHKKALPMTALSLVGLTGIFWFWQISLTEVYSMTYAYLILLSALTVPHAAMISWIETRNSSPMVSANI
jgi:Brp/Blh family beta-carotene 15,15'-monooxygenase